MKRIIGVLFLLMLAFSGVFAQKRAVNTDNSARRNSAEARQQAIAEANDAKQIAVAGKNAATTTSDFYDEDSFDNNVKFLGSFYAGTLYVYNSCDPAVLLSDLGITLAADDQCVVNLPTAPMATATVDNPLWQITIPKKTVKNVVYVMMNKGIGYESYATTPGQGNVFFSPRVTIISDALNDPAAIDPNTGLPMNGSFTTSLSGSYNKGFPITGYLFNYTNEASISSRGISRDYLAALGLPQSVINNFFKKEMTLQFGFRARISGSIDFGQFYYTYRILGQ
jgi:hypothetical protein